MRRLWPALVILAACTGEVVVPPQPIVEAVDAGPPDDGTCTPGATGVTPMIRLSREQLDHAAEDLLASTFVPSTAMTTDEKVGPFAANTSTQMTRSLAEQYQFVAEKLGAEVEARALTLAPCADQAAGAPACASAFIEHLGRLAFRRELSADEAAAYLALFVKVKADNTYALGIRSVAEAMLQSPSFLYRVELPPRPDAVDAFAVDQYALASRLSFLTWNSGPDDALLQAAKNGELGTSEGLTAQLGRLLADPKAARAMGAFTSAWAQLDGLTGAAQSPDRLAGLDPSLIDSMEDETVRFMGAALNDDAKPLEALFTGSWSVGKPALVQALYGVSSAPDAKGRIALDPAQRSGVLTHASVLFTHAHSLQSSPVLRGKWVRTVLFCQEVPDPPANVNATPPPPVPGQTTRERFSTHRTDPACSGCHRLLDDVGFGFEAYDQHGVFRTTDNARPVDASGVLVGTDVDGPFVGAPALGQKLVQSRAARLCFARQWFRFGMSRPEAASETCLVKNMSVALDAPKGYRALIGQLVGSQAFKERKAP